MHNVLKLYFGLRAKCLWRMIQELKLMVIPALLLFLFVGTLIVIKLVAAPIYFSVLLYIVLLLACHSVRGDSAFLYSTFGTGHTKMLFSVEYMLLSIPFICLFLYRGSNGGNDIISSLVYVFLNAIFYVSLIVPLAMLFSIIISGVLAYYAHCSDVLPG